MEFKGTRGKWVVAKANMKDTNKDELVISLEGGDKVENGYRLIACISPMDKADMIDVSNALLISKAPEMLEILQSLENDNRAIPEFMWNKIKKLIKEATEL